MTTYLTIITTVLVLTQVIRLIQNTMQLKHIKKIHKHDSYILSVYERLEKAIDKYLKIEENHCDNCKYCDCDFEDEPCASCKYTHISYFKVREEK